MFVCNMAHRSRKPTPVSYSQINIVRILTRKMQPTFYELSRSRTIMTISKLSYSFCNITTRQVKWCITGSHDRQEAPSLTSMLKCLSYLNTSESIQWNGFNYRSVSLSVYNILLVVRSPALRVYCLLCHNDWTLKVKTSDLLLKSLPCLTF